MKVIETLLARDVLLSLLFVGSVSLALGAGTWAFLEDSDASQNNSLVAGSLDLKLEGSDSLTTAFSLADASPGQSTSYNYTLTNDGAVSADHVEVSFSYSENDSSATEPSDPDLSVELNDSETASLIRVTTFDYRNNSGGVVRNLLAGVSDDNGNGIVDLQDLKAQRSTYDNLPAPQPSGANETYLVIALEIANDNDASFSSSNTVGNLTGDDEDIMADGVDVSITVTLNQDSSQ